MNTILQIVLDIYFWLVLQIMALLKPLVEQWLLSLQHPSGYTNDGVVYVKFIALGIVSAIVQSLGGTKKRRSSKRKRYYY